MILWDEWGLLDEERPSEADLRLLDRVAEVTVAGDADGARRLYETEPRLQVPSVVTSFSMVTEGQPRGRLRWSLVATTEAGGFWWRPPGSPRLPEAVGWGREGPSAMIALNALRVLQPLATAQ